MGELVDLDRYRARRAGGDEPADRLARERRLGSSPPAAPAFDDQDPEELGWLVVEEDSAGAGVRWFHPRWVAQIGRVPQAPEWVFLDHDGRIRAWHTLTVGELAQRLQVAWVDGEGEVPEPDVVLSWDGRPIEG